ncbi:MAG: hypothetical protein JRH20_23900 [Deltaproteobacteria bacterium]|nr:hypothetical protein [Deltaproteobacteria bacterium]
MTCATLAWPIAANAGVPSAPLTALRAHKIMSRFVKGKRHLSKKGRVKHLQIKRTLEGIEVVASSGGSGARRAFFFLQMGSSALPRLNQLVSVRKSYGVTNHQATIDYAFRKDGARVREEVALAVSKKNLLAVFGERLGRGAGTVRYERKSGRTWIDTVTIQGTRSSTVRQLQPHLDSASAVRSMQEALAGSRGDPLGKIWVGL